MRPEPLKAILHLALVAALGACGGDRAASPSRPTQVPSSGASGQYSLHEWGVLTVNLRGGTVGPRLDPNAIMVEKPVIYLHAEEPVEARIGVQLGAGLHAVETYPPSPALSWQVRATPGSCAQSQVYPTSCTADDGLCEVTQLQSFETTDASCLQVGSSTLPLLFYRLRAEPSVELPIEVRLEGSEVQARSRSGEAITAWRVRMTGAQASSSTTSVGGDWAVVPAPEEPGVRAADALSEGLGEAGLTMPERASFERAWWPEFFGIEVNSPVESVEETPMVVAEERSSGSRFPEVLLYLMPRDSIDGIARIDANPPPTEVNRAFVVRQVL